MAKPKFVIGTCVYNRTHTLPAYFKALAEKTKNPFHLYLVVNYDELWTEAEANKAMNEVMTLDNVFPESYTVIYTPNLGLQGYNIALEAAKILDVPCFLCNDDINPITQDWDEELLTIPTEANVYQQGLKTIRPETVGVLAPTYVNAGCNLYQEYKENPTERWYGSVSCIGHAQMITLNAVRKDFKFESEWCGIFGPFDIFQANWMAYHSLNTVVCRRVCFDFPNSQESAFSNGKPEKFTAKLTPIWEKMHNLIHKEYREMHLAKYGFNKWWHE